MCGEDLAAVIKGQWPVCVQPKALMRYDLSYNQPSRVIEVRLLQNKMLFTLLQSVSFYDHACDHFCRSLSDLTSDHAYDHSRHHTGDHEMFLQGMTSVGFGSLW